MDSTTALAQALEDGCESILAVSFDYGSKHGVAELTSAYRVVEWYAPKVAHRVITMPNIFHGSGSALMGEAEMPAGAYKDPNREGPNSTEVPFRNANMLSIATTLAMANGCQYVYAGMHGTDAQGWAYPDCSPEFLGAMANAIYVGTMHRVRLIAPFMHMKKSDIVTRAAILEAPLQLTWSCYEGQLVQCGVCPTCVERIDAFVVAGFADPVPYMTPVNWSDYEAWPTVVDDEGEEDNG